MAPYSLETMKSGRRVIPLHNVMRDALPGTWAVLYPTYEGGLAFHWNHATQTLSPAVSFRFVPARESRTTSDDAGE